MPFSSNINVGDLLQKARAGDESARDRLFQACRNYVAIAARAEMASWLKAKVDASDLVQQTLLEAHRGLNDFRGTTEAEWLGWLRRILVHNAADFVRRFHGVEKRRAGREVSIATGDDSDHPGLQLAAGDQSPSQVLLQKERQLQVADAVAKLSEDYQEVVILRNLQQLAFEEVAQRMGRSRPAVQMLWMRAIQKLQEILNQEDCGRPDDDHEPDPD
ncbi:MAG TPA: sigma-70 family RNA polymerase sigma factor [Planctomycetaceae bacterium]|jgi:RNA polymerase sigma-70 factor (ECF subfamily)